MSDQFHIYCCARSGVDNGRLQADLRRSPEIENGNVGLTILWDQASAAGAYARAMETATAEVLIFAHCDVYFPKGWFERLTWEVGRLSEMDPDWAVAGISSITPSGEQVGRMFDTALEPVFEETFGVFGKALTRPVPIVSADELVLIVRRGSGISFDPLLPEFHLYGTDIVLEAERQGRCAYGLDMPLIHNAKAQLRLGPDYGRAFRYMVRKWRDRLPVPTTCIPLTATPLTLTIARMRLRYMAVCKPSSYSTQRLSDPGAKATELGFEKMLAAPLCDN
jgi:hypothetical protein